MISGFYSGNFLISWPANGIGRVPGVATHDAMWKEQIRQYVSPFHGFYLLL